jgi:hypothetical protein
MRLGENKNGNTSILVRACHAVLVEDLDGIRRAAANPQACGVVVTHEGGSSHAAVDGHGCLGL